MGAGNSTIEPDDNCTLTETDKRRALLAMGIEGVAATIVCSVAVTLVCIFKLYKHFAHRLALYQVLAALLYGASLAMELVFYPDPNQEMNSAGCKAIGFFFLYFSLVKLMFTSWVVLHLLCFSVFYKNFQHLEKLFVCISIGLPLLIVWVPFINDAYGSSGAWCWIRNWQNDCSAELYTPGIAEQFGLLGLAMFCSIIDSIAIIVIISRLVCCQWSSEEVPLLMNERRMKFKALKELLPLLVYPILFCILLIPLVVNRAIDAIPNSPANVVVSTLVSGIFVPLQPFFAGLALLVHVCVLKCWTCKCFRKRRQHHYTAQDTFASEHPSTWRFTQGDNFTTRNPTEAYIPNESEVDGPMVLQKELYEFDNSCQ